MEFFYDTITFLKVLELVCGLLILGTVMKKFQHFRRFTEGAILIMISGFIIILKQIYDFSPWKNELPDEFFNLFIFLFFAIGILYFSKRLTMFEKKEERRQEKLEKKRKLREKYTPKVIKRKRRRK